MRPFNTKARWYEQLSLDEAQEIERLDELILMAKRAMARRSVIQKRALARIQARTRKARRLVNLDAIKARRPKDVADARKLHDRLMLEYRDGNNKHSD